MDNDIINNFFYTCLIWEETSLMSSETPKEQTFRRAQQDSGSWTPVGLKLFACLCVLSRLESDVMMAGWNMLEKARAEYRQDSLCWGGGRQKEGVIWGGRWGCVCVCVLGYQNSLQERNRICYFTYSSGSVGVSLHIQTAAGEAK